MFRGATISSVVPDWLLIVAAGAPLATVVAAVIAGTVAWVALAQRRTADRRDLWWKRTQWAIDEAMDADPGTQRVGLAVLNHLAISDLCGDEDEVLVDLVAKTVQDTLIDREALKPDNPAQGVYTESTAADTGTRRKGLKWLRRNSSIS